MRILRLLLLMFMLAPGLMPSAAAQDVERQERIRALLDQTELPYSKQAFEILGQQLRGTVVDLFLQQAGKSMKLGPGWARGDPWWNKSWLAVERTLQVFEKKYGPISRLGANDVAPHFNPPWSAEEIDFLTRYARTEEGRSFLRIVDAMIVAILARNAARDVNFSEKNLQAISVVEQRSREAFDREKQRVASYTGSRQEDYRRADALLGKISADGSALGKKLLEQSLLRFFRVAYDTLPELSNYIDAYRHSQTAGAASKPQ